jgi:hypothetical protein
MKGVVKRGSRYYVWVNVPTYARHLFDRPQIRQSLGTGVEAEAVAIAGPILRDIWRKIGAAKTEHRAGKAVAEVEVSPKNYTPEEIGRAFDRWTAKAIAESRKDHFNGTAPTFSPLTSGRWSG